MLRFVSTPRSKVLAWGLPALALVLLGLYLPSISPGVTFSDGGEIATGIATLGVIHPTGYPVFTVLAHMFLWVPLPLEAVVQISVFNSLLAVGAAVFTALSVRELVLPVDRSIGRGRTRTRVPDPVPVPCAWRADAAGLLAGLVLGIAPLFWYQVRIPEVYPLHVLLTAAAVFAWARFEVTRDPRYVVWSAVPMGLGLAHHVTMAYMLPAAGVYLLLRRPSFFVAWLVVPWIRVLRRILRRPSLGSSPVWRGWWQFPLACLLGALPLLSYGYLIWATEHTTGIPWGGVDDWDSLYAHATGRQYRHYMKGFDYEALPDRLADLPAAATEQFLVVGLVLAAIGLLVLLWRAWPFLLLLLGMAGANVAHALQYGVGDYKTYYLPAVVSVSVLIGIGIWRVAHVVHRRRSGLPWWLFAPLCLLAFLGLAWQWHAYGVSEAREFLGHRAVLGITIGIATAGALAVAGRLGLRWWQVRAVRGQPYRDLPIVIVGLLATLYVGVGIIRCLDFRTYRIIGDKHAAGIARETKPGSVYMTMGDGFLFTQWYYQHVLEAGRDVALVKLRGPTQRWYRDRYMPSHYPLACDPLWGKYAQDPELYRLHCETYGDRMALPEQDSWAKIAGGGFRRVRIRSKAEKRKFRAEGPPIKRGNDPRCKSSSFRRSNYIECACWNYYDQPYRYHEKCVHTHEDGGMAPRSKIEIYAQRVIEDHIDERPVYARNIFTARYSKKKNSRKWSGPGRLRPSGDYAIINRSRANQIVRAEAIHGVDPCANEQLQRIELPPPKPRRRRELPLSKRRPYKPNPWPTLLKFTFLTTNRGENSDHGTYQFHPGQTVNLYMYWYERYHYDLEAKDRKGERLTHGVRVCAYDPDGRRILLKSMVSGTHSKRVVKLPLGAAAKRGTYTVQACTVGEIDTTGQVPADEPCVRPILEYDFEVLAHPEDGDFEFLSLR